MAFQIRYLCEVGTGFSIHITPWYILIIIIVDLTVDWLNGRLYWIDSVTRQVEEYDLKTGHRAVVLTTGEAGTSSPNALTLLPYPNYG